MPLLEHLAELRRRLFIAALAIVIAAIAGWLFYEPIIAALQQPMVDFELSHPDTFTKVNFSGLTDGLAIQITVSLFVGMLIATPVWLYQIWAFVVPGLTKREKRVTLWFLLSSTPLFLTGCWLAYLTLPKAIDVLRGFTPKGAAAITPAADYLNFVLKFIVAFGVAFLLPVFIVGLNLAGLVSAAMLRKAWRGAVMGIMVFAAVITPTVDPYSMFLIGAPMVALYFLAMGVCAVMDRRRRKKDPSWLGTPDDEASSIDDLAEPLDP
ncbi:MAG: twin-arginine translocase subunit TatC [Actinomycetales bacterium]|nr:twin-arginine translocase subunit TatC [Candidatus Lutibacillus vidarii]